MVSATHIVGITGGAMRTSAAQRPAEVALNVVTIFLGISPFRQRFPPGVVGVGKINRARILMKKCFYAPSNHSPCLVEAEATVQQIAQLLNRSAFLVADFMLDQQAAQFNLRHDLASNNFQATPLAFIEFSGNTVDGAQRAHVCALG